MSSASEMLDLKLEIGRLKRDLDKSKKDSERLTFMIEADNDRERAYFSGLVYDDISVLNGADDDADIQEDFRRLIDLHMEERDKNKLRIALEACDELSKENAELNQENNRLKKELADKDWQPISKAGDEEWLLVGKWVGRTWHRNSTIKKYAVDNGYTHYFPLPDPQKESNA